MAVWAKSTKEVVIRLFFNACHSEPSSITMRKLTSPPQSRRATPSHRKNPNSMER